MSPLDWIDAELADLDEALLRRRLTTRRSAQSTTVSIDGREYLSFGSNDYLGLANDPRIHAAAVRAMESEGFGAGASPLLGGRSAAHERLEQQLAEFERAEAALLFASGYAANVGAITALAGRGDAVFSDELNHASIIDGCRLSRAKVVVYPHGDVDALKRLLDEHVRFRRRLIVSDSLFSMHGDIAPLCELATAARRHACMIMVDEAHATGVFGERGGGLVEAHGLCDDIHVRVGTLSKALGGHGGFACGSRGLIDWLTNRARSYIYSTAPPASAAAAAAAALDIVRDEPSRRMALLERAAELRTLLADDGWKVGQGESQIIPVFVNKAETALSISAALRERGIWIPAIRPPTVPAGASCLRVSLTSAHTREDIDRLHTVLRECRSAAP